ncbi:MAG: hypothetical protein Q9M32_01400 [Sulfurimonas sp.]|nr:hypothetical protein [Sulfurimonas sp.]MDQ7062586.1 hypothetical protein [Sulfurimonas sp.]
MVESKSTARLFSISRSIVLTQTDTTVGFVSQNKTQLEIIKSRDTSKEFLKVFSSFKELAFTSLRIPPKHKNTLRRSKRTTFIVKSRAFRIAQYPSNSQILRDLKWNYSTSANERSKNFVFSFCEDKADIIIEDKNGLRENSSSHLIKINNLKKVRIR